MIWMDPAVVVRLGWTLVHFLWQGAVLAGALALLFWLTKGRSPRLRHGLACLVLAVMAVAPALTWIQLGRHQVVGHGAVALAVATTTDRPTAPSAKSSRSAGEVVAPNQPWERVLPWGVGLWFLGVATMSLRLASGWAWLQWLRRRPATVPASDDIQLRLLRLCQRMSLASNIRILLCEKVPGPTVMGWLRPVILLPPAALLGMPPEQLELVLAHELAHILRQDYAINLLQSCVEVLLFYHPAVWWVSAKIRQERELCCDDLAVRTTGDALDYAAALTRLEALCRPPDPPRHAALALGATGGSFMHRIRRLISPMAPTPLAPRAGLVLVLMIGFSFVLQAARPREVASVPGGELVLRRFNAPTSDGVAKVGQIAFDGVRVPAEFGLQALDRLASIPASGPITELRLPIPTNTQPETGPYSYNFPAVDPSQLRLILENHAREKPLTLQSCPRHGVIIRRLNAATPRFSPLPGKSRLSVVANDADLSLVDAALSELVDLKPVPFLFQRVEKRGQAPSDGDQKLTIELSNVSADEFRMVLDSERVKQPHAAATPIQKGTIHMRRYDQDAHDGARKAGTVDLQAAHVTAAELEQALASLARLPRDPAKGHVDMEVRADLSQGGRGNMYSYEFRGCDPSRVKRVIQAREGFPYLEDRDKKRGHIVIQRLARFTYELGLLPQGLHVQVWAGEVPIESVLEALNELMAMAPEAGIPQEVRRQLLPGSGKGKRISLDLVDKDPLQLWKELDAAVRNEPH